MAAAAIPSRLGARERWLTSGLLGIGLSTFAILASLTSLILPAVLVSNRLWRHFRQAKTVSTVSKKHLAKHYQSH